MANEFNIKNGFISNSNSLVLGTLSASTVSATTYLNLPIPYALTGFSVTNNTINATFSGGTTTASTINAVTGGTFSGGVITLSGTGVVNGTQITGLTYLKWYAENAAAPLVAPTATGSGSIALGNGAQALTNDMFVYGTSAGTNASIASNSVFIGYQAGSGSTLASNSVFIGQFAGAAGSTANNSNFLGQNAGYATNATSSNFLGQNAGQNATSASASNFFGSNAGIAATTANNSNFFGQTAGAFATNAQQSNFFGVSAGSGATSAYYSNFFGKNSGFNQPNANYSIFIGFQTAYNIQSTGTNFLGPNNIIIGTNVTLPSGTTNSMNIGGVIYAIGLNSNTGTTPTFFPSSGSVGINVVSSAITNVLHVSASTNPVRFVGLQAASDSLVVTTDANGVLHTYPISSLGGGGGVSYTALTFNSSNNTLTLVSSSSTLSTQILVVSGLTSTGTVSTTTISATTYQNLPIDVRVTGGTYNTSTGIITFTNNTGATFTVGGFTLPNNNVISAVTLSNNVLSVTSSGGTPTTSTVNAVTGGTYNANNGVITLSGTGVVNGNTISGLPFGASANTAITAFTYNSTNNTFSITNTTGGTLNAQVLTLSGITIQNGLGVFGVSTFVGQTYFSQNIVSNNNGFIQIGLATTDLTFSTPNAGSTAALVGLRIFNGSQDVLLGTGTTDTGYKLDVVGSFRASSGTITNGFSAATISATTYLNLPASSGGGTPSITGFSVTNNTINATISGGTTTASTINAVTGGTYNSGTGIITLSGTGVVNGTQITGFGTSSSSATTIYTGDGTLVGNRVVGLSSFTLNFSSATQPNTLVLSGGNVGINVSGGTNKLHVSAATDPVRFVGIQSGTTDTLILSIDNTGVVHSRNAPDAKAGLVANTSFTGSTTKKAQITFTRVFASTNYVIVVTGEDSRTWTTESKTVSGFIINSNSNQALAGNTSWIAREIGET